MIHEFEPTRFHTTIGSHEPVLRVGSGDVVRTWTVDSGGYDRHVRRMRIVYRRRRDRLLAAVQGVTGIDAGLHAVVELDDDEAAVVARAGRHDLIVEGLDGYRFCPAKRGPALVDRHH